MGFFNFWKNITAKDEENAENLNAKKVLQGKNEIDEIGDSIKHSLMYIDNHVRANTLTFEDYVERVVIPQYQPLETLKDKQLAKNLIADFKENPQYNSDSRVFMLFKHFFGDVASIISYADIKDIPFIQILNDLDRYINLYSQKANSSDKYSFELEALQKNHVNSLHIVDEQIKKVKLDNEGKPIDYNKLMVDRLYRIQIENHYNNLFQKIAPNMAVLSNYTNLFEKYYKDAQQKMGIRQRAVVSLITTMMFIKKLGSFYYNVVQTKDELALHDWMSISFPKQWDQLLQLHGASREMLNSSENPELILKNIPIPKEWHSELFEQINKFVDDCSLSYENFNLRAKEHYLFYQSDIMVCSNLSKLLHSANFDKRMLNFLNDTELNIHYSKIIDKVNQAFVYNERLANPHLKSDNLMTLSQIHKKVGEVSDDFIANAEKKILEAQQALEELKKKDLMLKNSIAYNYQEALKDTQKATFKNQREFEYYVVNKMGNREIFIQPKEFELLNSSFFKTLNLKLFEQLKQTHEFMFIHKDVSGSSFYRFFKAIPYDESLELIQYLKKKQQYFYSESLIKLLKTRDLIYLDFIVDKQKEIIDLRISVCDIAISDTKALLEYNNQNVVQLEFLFFEATPFEMTLNLGQNHPNHFNFHQ